MRSGTHRLVVGVAAIALAIAAVGAVTGGRLQADGGTAAPVYDGYELDYQPSLIRVVLTGELVMVFERLTTRTYRGDLYRTASTDGGRTWGEPQPIIATSASERHPALVQLRSGGFALFYLRTEAGDGASRIHRATSANGATWVPEGPIDLGYSTPGEINPSVISEADGSLTMTYHRLSGPSYIARSTDEGATWDRLAQVSPGAAALPRIAKREADGTYLVTFQTNPGDNDLDLWAKTTTDPHDWSGPLIPVSTDANSHDSQPIVLEDGTFVVFYAMQADSAFDVFYRRSDDGRVWSMAVRVTENPERYDTQPHPLLHGTPGQVILAWPRQDYHQPYIDHDVWVDSALTLDLGDGATTLYLPVASREAAGAG